MAVLLAAAVLVDSKPPPQPVPRAGAGGYGLSDSVVRHLRRCRLSRPAPRAPLRRLRATMSARSTSCRSTTRSSATSTEIRGDMRDHARARELCAGADVARARGRGAADPRLAPRDHVRERRRDGHAARGRARGRRWARRLHLVDRGVRRAEGASARARTSRSHGVGPYGESKIACEELVRASPLESVVIRPKTFLGPERLGVFEILFDWIRDGRRIYVLGGGGNRYQLLAVEDLVDAIDRACDGGRRRRGLQRRRDEFGTVRSDLEALIAHAGTTRACARFPRGRPSSRCAGSSSRTCRRSASGTTRPRRATRSSTSRRPSGCSAGTRRSRTSTRSSRTTTGTPRTARGCRRPASTHRVPWNQQALAWLKKVS